MHFRPSDLAAAKDLGLCRAPGSTPRSLATLHLSDPLLFPPNSTTAAMTLNAATVLVVSPEPTTLRRIRRILTAFGCDVLSRREIPSSQDVGQYVYPQFVIVDERAMDARFQSLSGFLETQAFPAPYILLLRDPNSRDGILEAFAAGVDDFLEKPVNSAELLSRLNAGACYRETRLSDDDLIQSDLETGLLTEGAFVRWLGRQPANSDAPGCCVLIEIDLLRQLAARIGWPSARVVLRAVAGIVSEHCLPHAEPFRQSPRRLGAFLPNVHPERAREWTEELRAKIANSHCAAEVKSLDLTASAGIAARTRTNHAPHKLLAEAVRALDRAITDGGDCTVLSEDLAGDPKESVGSLESSFTRSRARDVMTSLSVFLQLTDTVGSAIAKLTAARLEFAPVVDDGRFQGVVCRDELAKYSLSQGGAQAPVRSVLAKNVVQVNEETPLPDVIEVFRHGHCEVAIVVRQAQPTGTITARDLSVLRRPTDCGSRIPTDEDPVDVNCVTKTDPRRAELPTFR